MFQKLYNNTNKFDDQDTLMLQYFYLISWNGVA